MASSKKPPIVEVDWLDARTIYEQLPIKEAVEKVTLSRRQTVGYLIHKDREKLIVAGTFDPAEKRLTSEHTEDDDGGADFTAIPRGWVSGVTILNPEAQPQKEDAQ